MTKQIVFNQHKLMRVQNQASALKKNLEKASKPLDQNWQKEKVHQEHRRPGFSREFP